MPKKKIVFCTKDHYKEFYHFNHAFVTCVQINHFCDYRSDYQIFFPQGMMVVNNKIQIFFFFNKIIFTYIYIYIFVYIIEISFRLNFKFVIWKKKLNKISNIKNDVLYNVK